MTKKRRYTPRYILGLCILPFLIVGYFFKKIVWKYLTKKKPFIEWTVLVLSVTFVILIISGILRGDFKPTKESMNLSPRELKKKGGH
ncbi:MAG: hypothetical protein ACLQQ4_11190 [Bacteroidia bacterium]